LEVLDAGPAFLFDRGQSMVDWDWDANPTYESERIRIDASSSPAIFYDLKLPRQLEDHEAALLLSVAEYHLEHNRPFLLLINHERGTGVISARNRKIFADWLEAHRDEIARDDFALVIVLPEAIFRAVLRVVYRFRTPPLRTLTVSDLPSALARMRSELARIGQASTPSIEAFFDQLR
jgi:hypothetical protein